MKLRSCILATLFVCCFLYITGCGAFKYRPHFIKYRSRGANGGGQRGLQFTAPKTANYKTYYYESKVLCEDFFDYKTGIFQENRQNRENKENGLFLSFPRLLAKKPSDI